MAIPRRRTGRKAGSLRARQQQRRNQLLRGIGERPRGLLSTLLLDARVRVLRRRLEVRRQLLNTASERFDRFAELLDTISPDDDDGRPDEKEAVEELDGLGSGYSAAGQFTDTLRDIIQRATVRRRGAVTRLVPNSGTKSFAQAASESSTGEGKPSRRKLAFFDIFGAMEGEKGEFTKDGLPKVTAVNDRLESLRQESTNRAEIEQAYEEYKRLRPKMPGHGIKLDERAKAIMRIIDDMIGEESEFTQDGRPQVDSVNERLESLGHERATRPEIDRVYKIYLGE